MSFEQIPGLISILFTSPVAFFLIAIILIAAITIHEFAHAWMADRLGDPTPRVQGRVTLNPLAHLDPMGTALLFFIGFGWGKPVMFDPYNLKNPVKDTAIIAAAGPASNLAMAAILAILIPVLINLAPGTSPVLYFILSTAIYYNCMLAIFNLLPLHPLDGGKILSAMLPPTTALEYDRFMYRYGQLVLLALIIPWGGVSPLSTLISPPIMALTSLFMNLADVILKLG
jgi:Zn-dependent protease